MPRLLSMTQLSSLLASLTLGALKVKRIVHAIVKR